MPNRTKFIVPKRGPFNRECMDFIDRHAGRFTAEQIAARLGVTTLRVENYLAKTAAESGGPKAPAKREMKLADELETRPEWDNFKEQFTERELAHFKYRYVQLMGQFRDDILPTEELQIFQVITLDIMIQRTLREQKAAVEEMERINKELESLHDQAGSLSEINGPGDIKAVADGIKAAESRYATLSDVVKVLSQRHESYLMRQSAMLKDIKGTRDQRVKIFENSKQSFLGYLRALSEEDFRMKEGRDAALMKAATDKKAAELARPHVYADGSTDRPMLTPEIMLAEGEEDEDAQQE
jgi:hypothetical protein